MLAPMLSDSAATAVPQYLAGSSLNTSHQVQAVSVKLDETFVNAVQASMCGGGFCQDELYVCHGKAAWIF